MVPISKIFKMRCYLQAKAIKFRCFEYFRKHGAIHSERNIRLVSQCLAVPIQWVDFAEIILSDNLQHLQFLAEALAQ